MIYTPETVSSELLPPLNFVYLSRLEFSGPFLSASISKVLYPFSLNHSTLCHQTLLIFTHLCLDLLKAKLLSHVLISGLLKWMLKTSVFVNYFC